MKEGANRKAEREERGRGGRKGGQGEGGRENLSRAIKRNVFNYINHFFT